MNNEVQYGDLSAVLLQNTPFWGHWLRTPDLSIALMDEWENKIEKLAINTIKEKVTSVSGVPTWTMVLFKRILDITGKKTISDVWPSLELFMHGGVCFCADNCIMQVKGFLRHMIFLVKRECCCSPIMAFL
jgi:hypothetical protein